MNKLDGNTFWIAWFSQYNGFNTYDELKMSVSAGVAGNVRAVCVGSSGEAQCPGSLMQRLSFIGNRRFSPLMLSLSNHEPTARRYHRNQGLLACDQIIEWP